MKSFIMRAAIGIGILLSLSGCEEYEGVDYLNIGHPADPVAPTGKPARLSGALVSENINVKPELGSIGVSSSQMNKSAPVMKKKMVDHSKMKMPKAKKPKMAPAKSMRGSH